MAHSYSFFFFFFCHTSTQYIVTWCCWRHSSSPRQLQIHSSLQPAACNGNTLYRLVPLFLWDSSGHVDAHFEEALLSPYNLSKVLWSPSQPSINIKYTDNQMKEPTHAVRCYLKPRIHCVSTVAFTRSFI